MSYTLEELIEILGAPTESKDVLVREAGSVTDHRVVLRTTYPCGCVDMKDPKNGVVDVANIEFCSRNHESKLG